MQMSDEGLELLKTAEGFRAETYVDPAGFPTIGYGHRLLKGEAYPGGIDEAKGRSLLAADVAYAERCVTVLVHVALTQGQFDALVDFVFNLGPQRLAGSTLLTMLNAGRYDAAASQLLDWDHGNVNGKMIELAGLKARRAAEYSLWHQAA